MVCPASIGRAQALAEQGIDTALATRLHEAFFNTADWMRNKGG